MKKIRILNSEPSNYCDEAKGILKSFAQVDYTPLNSSEIIDKISEYEILIVRIKNSVDKKILKKAKRLVAVATATTGTNHIDEYEMQKKGIEVISLKGETEFLRGIYSTAEHTILLILSLMKNFRLATQFIDNNKWYSPELRGQELHKKKIGIVGFGRLGKMVAKMCKSFGMKISAYDKDESTNFPDYVKKCSLGKLLRTSDILTIHIPLNKRNKGFIDKNKIDMMKDDAIIINTSRGDVIDEDYLVESLIKNKIRGAGLDVISDEGIAGFDPKDSKIIQFSKKNHNLIITPHIGGASLDAINKTDIFLAKKIKKFMEEFNAEKKR